MRLPRGNRILLSMFLLLVIGVVIIGLDDVPGYVLGYLATSIIFFMMVRRWTRIRRFIILLLASVAGIIFLSFLYVEVISRIIVFIGGAGAVESVPARIIEWSITYIILFGGAVGIATGLIGTSVLTIYRLVIFRRKKNQVETT